MNQLNDTLKILLKRMPEDEFIENRQDCRNIDKKFIYNIIHNYVSENSDTEIKNMLDELKDTLKEYSDFKGLNINETDSGISVYDAIMRFANEMLVKQNNEVLCRYERILDWRDITIDLSEETFVCAFLAQISLERGVQEKNFSWQPVIRHNNIQLRRIMEKGLAENHFHLTGSSPNFYLSWIKLMNELGNSEYMKRADDIDSNIRTSYLVTEKDRTEKSIRQTCQQAALIRLYLFSIITDTEIEIAKYYIESSYLYSWAENFDEYIDINKFRLFFDKNTNFTPAYMLNQVCKEIFADCKEQLKEMSIYISILDRILGKHIDYDDIKDKIKSEGNRVYLKDILLYLLKKQNYVLLREVRMLLPPDIFKRLWDQKTYEHIVYALENREALINIMDILQNIINNIVNTSNGNRYDYALLALDYRQNSQDELYYILSGERHLMYRMFRRIFKNDGAINSHIYNMFYAYLIIKEKMRGELVQSNNIVGFENFQIIQDRKDYFLKGEYYERLKTQIAVIGSMRQNLIYLELRISPGNTPDDIYNYIKFIDDSIESKEKLRGRYYYVMHFIKRPDDNIDDKNYCQCRHYKLRVANEQKAMALINFRRRFSETAEEVLGIDAASQEIVCRPEVFAQAFRALQSDTYSYYNGNATFKKLPQLRATYHVGEDFLDVTDGLRAIDEAINFLNLDCGSRLGHAIALGISPRDWYESKDYNIFLPKQDYLDNIVWLYHSIIKYNIEDFGNLKNKIENEYAKFFDEIYGEDIRSTYVRDVLESINEDGSGNINVDFFDINSYYNAWRLRGDSPELYKKGYFCEQYKCHSDYEKQAVNRRGFWSYDIRKKFNIAFLYYLYHYSCRVRLEGKRKINVRVTDEYINAVTAVQKALQREIAERGIGIETNPSSNYLIGTFRHYAKHPITTFYNKELTNIETFCEGCPQLWVSINTDDQGIFGTNLENEYAFMARALEVQKDKEGNPMFKKAAIYDWLDKIREMGIKQSFAYVGRNDILDKLDKLDASENNIYKLGAEIY